MTKKYYAAVKTLEDLFHQFNDHFFDSELECPVITISPDTTSGAYGWCTTQKIWKSGEETYYEINICAEHLNRSFNEVCATLIHEMVHLHNIGNGVKDTSANGRYHNTTFKKTAEQHGLNIEKSERNGWSTTKLQDETAAWIAEHVECEGFDLARAQTTKKAAGKKSKYHYYMCPCCGVKFYSVHQISATCDICAEPFVQYK